MRNIRVWSDNYKRCEAVWLGHLLTICGCQVWKGRLGGKYWENLRADEKHRYVDVILLGQEKSCRFMHSLGVYRGLNCLVSCEPELQIPMMRNNPNVFGICGSLEMNRPESIQKFMNSLSRVIARSLEEQKAILQLSTLFVKNDNRLSRCIYTITEMFCSRRIDYTKYQNIGVLKQSVFELDEWIREYIAGVNEELTYPEMFAICYLQNLVNEGYIKARTRGGYDTSLLFRNANYMLKNEADPEAVHFLKLQILHNSINFRERADDILETIRKSLAPEYISKACCEAGDIYREDQNRRSDFPITDYYENMDAEDSQNYCGFYRCGLLYEEKGIINTRWWVDAKEKYDLVSELIGDIESEYRTPQEFEYYYKARYGSIEMAVRLGRASGILSEERRKFYRDQLTELARECVKFDHVTFIKKMYGEGEEETKIRSLMNEKMSKVHDWAKSLMADIA